MGHSAQTAPEPTPAEKALRTAFSQGNRLDLDWAGRRHEHGSLVHAERLIHGPALRDLLLSTVSPPAGHVQQLTVVGADIEGRLDLQFAKIDFPIRLEDCCFDSPVTLSEAELRSVSLRDSTAQQTINASHVRVTGDLMLDGLHVTGPLQLGGAHLEDDLHLTGARIDLPVPERAGPGGPVPKVHDEAPSAIADGDGVQRALLDLDNIEVKGTVLADRLNVQGEVSMKGATVGGTVHLKGLCAKGQVDMVDAQMQSLVLRSAHIESQQSALMMDRLQCTGSLFCDRDIELTGGIHAIGIKVGATLYLGKGEVSAPREGDEKEWAVSLQRARISDDLTCAIGFSSIGTFDMTSAHIGGSVDLCGATMKPVEGQTIGFTAGRAQIGGNLMCTNGFTCDSAMGLVNAKIDGWFELDETSDGHDCFLAASGVRVGRDVDLRTSGRIDLSGADVTGNLTIDLARLAGSGHEPAANLSALTARVLKLAGRQQQGRLDLTRASVRLLLDNPAEWHRDKEASPPIPARVKHVLRLKPIFDKYLDSARASVRLLLDDPAEWHRDKEASPPIPARAEHVPRRKSSLDDQREAAAEISIVLDGLVYEDVAAAGTPENPKDRLDWLEAGTQQPGSATDVAGTGARARHHPPGFAPQPYQQLAAVYRRNGRDHDARDVLHTMYCRQNAVMHKGHPVLRAWNTTQNLALGYGYRPKRAFGWILLLAAATTMWIVLFDNQAHIGIVAAAILSLGLALPGSGLDKIQRVVEMSPTGHLFALGLVLAGLVLGATVIAAIGRVIKN